MTKSHLLLAWMAMAVSRVKPGVGERDSGVLTKDEKRGRD